MFEINTNKSAHSIFLFSLFLILMIESSQSSTETAEDIYSNSSSSRTASIRSRSGSGRVSTTDLDRLSIPTAVIPPAPPAENNRSPRVYASVAEMKRMRVRLSLSFQVLKRNEIMLFLFRSRRHRLSCWNYTRNSTAHRNCVGSSSKMAKWWLLLGQQKLKFRQMLNRKRKIGERVKVRRTSSAWSCKFTINATRVVLGHLVNR